MGAAIAILVPTAGIFSYASAQETSLATYGVKMAQEAPLMPQLPPVPQMPQDYAGDQGQYIAPGGMPGQMPAGQPGDDHGQPGPNQPYQGYMPQQGQPGQGFPGGQGQNMGPGNGGPGMGQGNGDQNMGPDQMSDEQQQKNDEKRNKQEAKQLAQIKKGMKQAAKQIARVKAAFAKVTAKGIAIPSDCTDAITTAQGVVDSVQNAADFEAMQDIDMNELGDAMSTLNECQPKVQMLARLPQMLKQIDTQIKKIERTWTTAKKGAPADAADAVADGDAAIAAIREGRAKVEDLAKQGQIDDFGDALDENVFSKFDDISAIVSRINAAKNAKRFLASVPVMLKTANKTIAKLKKAGEDTTEAEVALATVKDLYATVKGLKAGTEEYAAAVEDLAQAGQDFAEVAGATDGQTMMGAPIQGSASGMPTLQMPNLQGMNFGGGMNMGPVMPQVTP